MPRLKREVVEQREALARKLFGEGKTIDQVQAALQKHDGMKMAPGRLQEIMSETKPQQEPKLKEPPVLDEAPEPDYPEPDHDDREGNEASAPPAPDLYLQGIMNRPRPRFEIDMDDPRVKEAIARQEEEQRRQEAEEQAGKKVKKTFIVDLE